MRIIHRWSIITTLLVLLFVLVPGIISSQDEEVEEAETTALESEDGKIDLTDEELDILLTNVDRFFLDQGMANLTVDVAIYRDPSNRLNERNIRTGDPSRIAGLSTIVSHFRYAYPDFYELKIMGEVLAGSNVPTDRTFFSQLLPLPGSPIYTEDIQERFFIRFDGTDEVDGIPVYRVRYSALDGETEFFDFIVYFIDVEREVILRVESIFDNGWYVGTGQGNFYYDEWLGKYLPIYGHGSVFFQPNRNFNVWGRWYSWDWDSEEETGSDENEVTIEEETPVESELSEE